MVSSRIRRAAAGTVIGLLALGCGQPEPGAAADSAARARKILRVAYNREIDVLNAFTSQMLIDIHLSMVEGLITTDENNTYVCWPNRFRPRRTAWWCATRTARST